MPVYQVIELILFLVQLTNDDPKQDATNGRKDCADGIVPNEQRIQRERCCNWVRIRSQTTTNDDDVQTKASPMAAEAALMKRNTDMTKLRMFVGALVNAYSRPVIDAKISEKAMSTYLYAPSTSIHRGANSKE